MREVDSSKKEKVQKASIELVGSLATIPNVLHDL